MAVDLRKQKPQVSRIPDHDITAPTLSLLR